MKKVLVFLLSLVVISNCIFAQGEKEQTKENGPVEITFWSLFTGGDGEFFDAMVDEFNKSQNEVIMKNDTVKFDNYYTKLTTALAANNAPDLVIVHRNNLSLGPNRLIEDSYYSPLKAWASLIAYRDKGLNNSSYTPSYYLNEYKKLSDTSYPKDMYEFMKTKYYVEHKIDPSDFSARSNYKSYSNGITVPSKYVLPLGDNRDNSHDGRYFGPVAQSTVIGRVFFRFWPINRISYLGNK